MIAYRNSLFSLLVNETKVCIIQCQVLVVGVVVKTLNRQSVKSLEHWKNRTSVFSCPNPKTLEWSHTSPLVLQGPMHNLQPYTLSRDYKQTSCSVRKKMNWEWIITETWERKIEGYAATTQFGREGKSRSEIDIQDGLTHLSKNMSTRVPERVTPFVAVKLEQLQVAVAFQRPRHVPEYTVHLSYQTAGR